MHLMYLTSAGSCNICWAVRHGVESPFFTPFLTLSGTGRTIYYQKCVSHQWMCTVDSSRHIIQVQPIYIKYVL